MVFAWILIGDQHHVYFNMCPILLLYKLTLYQLVSLILTHLNMILGLSDGYRQEDHVQQIVILESVWLRDLFLLLLLLCSCSFVGDTPL